MRRFGKIAFLYWQGPGAWRSWVLLISLISAVLLEILVQYLINIWNRDFFNAIERRDLTVLFTEALAFIPLAVASLVFALISVWGRQTLHLRWRASLSEYLYTLWLSEDRIGRMRALPADHRMAEYRIAEDGGIATELPIELGLGLLTAVVTAITFVGVLWSVGDGLQIVVFERSVTVHGYLVYAVVLYSAIVTGGAMLIGRNLARITGSTKRAEAELRAIGSGLREAAERDDGEPPTEDPKHAVTIALGEVTARRLALRPQSLRMTAIAHGNLLLASFVALLLCAPKYISNAMTLGEVIQASAAFVVVQVAFNWIANSYGRIAEWTSSVTRVSTLLYAFDRLDLERLERVEETVESAKAD
ncbi:MAG: ABC transporter [Alphaproteobacteria bacterium]|nr:MAG: ABC transporter [Alphaproteobacteria bacterium]